MCRTGLTQRALLLSPPGGADGMIGHLPRNCCNLVLVHPSVSPSQVNTNNRARTMSKLCLQRRLLHM
jgi:hypothetical protein